MLAFEILFPIVMIAFPLVYVLFLPTDDQADASECKRRLKRLALWTFLSIVVFAHLLGVRLYLEGLGGEGSATAAKWLILLERIFHFIFFPLWFVLAVPLVKAKRPHLASGAALSSEVRSASLVPRQVLANLSPWTNWLPIFNWVIGVLVCGLALWNRPDSGNPTLGYVFLMLGLAAFAMLAAPLIRRGMIAEPEPMDPGNSQKLAEAYANYRNTKSYGLYLLSVTMQVFLIGAAVMLAFGMHENAQVGTVLGLAGGIGGSLVGIAGGVFGTLLGHRRMKIQELLGQLRSQHAQAEGVS